MDNSENPPSTSHQNLPIGPIAHNWTDKLPSSIKDSNMKNQIVSILDEILPEEELKQNFKSFATQLAKIPRPTMVQEFDQLRMSDILIPNLSDLVNLITYKPANDLVWDILGFAENNRERGIWPIRIGIERLKNDQNFLKWHLTVCLANIDTRIAGCLRIIITCWFGSRKRSCSKRKRMKNNETISEEWIDSIDSVEIKATLLDLNFRVNTLVENGQNPLKIYNIDIPSALQKLELTEQNVIKGSQSIEQLNALGAQHSNALISLKKSIRRNC